MMWLTGSRKMLQASGFRLQAKSYTKHVACSMQSLAQQGFSFVELMITMVVVTVGLVFIIQGFIVASNVLDTAQNYLRVIPFLDAKIQDIEASARINNGVDRHSDEGEFVFLAKNFNWNLEVVSTKQEGDPDLSEDLNEVSLKVSWQERNSAKDLSVVTYLRNKKEE
jgi:prepilin-type N-terminal cleavage/methylation domain-containing protein